MKVSTRIAAGAAVLLLTAGAAQAGEQIARASAPGGTVPIASSVTVPGGSNLYFLSGSLPGVADPAAPKGSVQAYGDTRTQAASVLGKLKANLESLGLSPADVVQATVYLVGDPAKGGEIDFAGLNAAWSEVFGTEAQPNRPARSTVKVAGLVLPGALVEIDFIAARAK